MDPDPSPQDQPPVNVFDALLSVRQPRRAAEDKGPFPRSHPHAPVRKPRANDARPMPNGDPALGPLELMDWLVELETKAAAIRALDASTSLTRGQAAYIHGKAEQQKHEAAEAEHRAAKEPERQEMSLRERKLKMVVLVAVVVFIMAFLVTCLLISPWLFLPVGTGFGALAFLARGRIKGFVAEDHEGRDP
jgi:hypothetical protein